MSLLYIERRETPPLYKGESVSLLYREEADSFSIERRESLLYIERRETPSLFKGESVPLPHTEEADTFSIKRRECLSSI